jgi:hypothetical protein
VSQLIIPVTFSMRSTWTRHPTFNFSNYAEFAKELQTIVSATVTVANNDGALTVGAPQINGAFVQVRVSGGTLGATYNFVCTINTSNGDVLDMKGNLAVIP